MRVLTVRQPWASAIFLTRNPKTVENRTTNVFGSYRGTLAIHSAAREHAPYIEAANAVFDLTLAWILTSPLGCVVGVVDLVDAHHGASDQCNCPEGWPMLNHWHGVLENPRSLAAPIPAKGRLGLWRPDDALALAIQEAL